MSRHHRSLASAPGISRIARRGSGFTVLRSASMTTKIEEARHSLQLKLSSRGRLNSTSRSQPGVPASSKPPASRTVAGAQAYPREPPGSAAIGQRKAVRTDVNEIKLARQRLADAVGLPAVLAAGWEIFELICGHRRLERRRGLRACIPRSPSRGVLRSAAADAIAFAPSTPPSAGDPVPSPPEPARDVYETADALAGLASALRMRLREVGRTRR